ncbi:unnamed protein product [Lactuca saligna]|uniref:Uncharacterized protein n=1 Tax=Lactuca saligna TaxID=75948 RepID=A0AA35YR17_LACSI|nr:unnamed protein product [Lactuca saligna]
MQFNHDNVRPVQLQYVEVLPKKAVNILKEISHDDDSCVKVLLSMIKVVPVNALVGRLDFLKYNKSSLMKLPCKIFDPIPLGEAVDVERMKDVDSVAMPKDLRAAVVAVKCEDDRRLFHNATMRKQRREVSDRWLYGFSWVVLDGIVMIYSLVEDQELLLIALQCIYSKYHILWMEKRVTRIIGAGVQYES